MAEAYERERQNNSRLDELAGKVSALRGVTVDIYDSARNTEAIDASADAFSSLSTSLKGSAARLGRAARAGDRVAVLKVAGLVSAVGILVYLIVTRLF